MGVDEVHSSGNFEVFVVDAVGHSSGFRHWSLPEVPYLSFEGYRNSQIQSIFGGGDVVPGWWEGGRTVGVRKQATFEEVHLSSSGSGVKGEKVFNLFQPWVNIREQDPQVIHIGLTVNNIRDSGYPGDKKVITYNVKVRS